MKSSNQINFYDFGEIEIVVGESAHSFPMHIHHSMCTGLITPGSVEFICKSHTVILTKGDIYRIQPGDKRIRCDYGKAQAGIR